MERRSFVLGLLALAAGSALSLRIDEAEAAPAAPATAGEAASELTLPDGTALDWAQHRGWDRNPHHRHWRHPPRHHRRRHRRQVCRVHRDRFGRRVRRCHWVWV